jgi:hypothetical protein
MSEDKEYYKEWLYQSTTREVIQKLKNAIAEESMSLVNCTKDGFEEQKGFARGVAYAVDLIETAEDA